jgi:hypothetical protein
LQKFVATYLDQLALLRDLRSIAFPYGIGCGLAGGNWKDYSKLLEAFAEKVTGNGVSVTLYRLSK